MRKSKFYILGLVISIFIVLFLFSFNSIAENLNIHKLFGEKNKKINNDKNFDVVIAKINGYDIHLRDYEMIKSFLALSGKKPKSVDVFDELKKRIILKNEANKRNITVTDEEVKTVIQVNKENIEKLKNENPEEVKSFLSYLEGLNMTEDEYWQSKEVFEVYRQSILKGKVRQAILNELKKNGNFTENELLKKYLDYLENEKKKLKLEIIRTDLIKD